MTIIAFKDFTPRGWSLTKTITDWINWHNLSNWLNLLVESGSRGDESVVRWILVKGVKVALVAHLVRARL